MAMVFRHLLRAPALVVSALALLPTVGVAEPLIGVTATKATVTTFELPEVTAAAFGPGENPQCNAGRLIVARGGTVESLDLAGGSAQETKLFALALPSVSSFIYDNHLIRLGDDLIYSVEGWTHQDLPCMSDPRPCADPDWWDLFATHPAKGSSKSGARSAIWFFRSTNCGVSWSLQGMIDAATLAVQTHLDQTAKGLCGPPRPVEKMVCNDAAETEDLSTCPGAANQKLQKKSELGGFDGHYFAGHAESGRLVVSTMCVFGTQLTPGNDKRQHILAVSDNGGASWSARVVPRMGDPAERPTVEPLKGMWRAPVIALDDDQWAFVYGDESKMEVRVVADDPFTGTFSHADSLKVATWTKRGSGADEVPLDTHFRSVGRDLALNSVPAGSSQQPGVPGSSTAFQHFVQVASFSWNAGKTLRYRVHNVNLNGETVATATSSISPADSAESVLLGAFIQGQRASLYYWLEERTNGKFRVRYQVYNRGKPMLVKGVFKTQAPGIVQGASGEHTFTGSTAKFHGDYMNGAHYLGPNGTEHFVLVWNEVGTVAFAEVRVHGLNDSP